MEKLSSNIAHTHCTFTRAASLPGHVSTSHTRSSAHRSDSWFSSAPSALTYAPHRSSEGRGGEGRAGTAAARQHRGLQQAECSGRAPFASAPERCPAEPEPAAALRAARAFPASPHHPARPGARRASPPHHLRSRSRMSLSCRQGKAFWGRGRNAKPAAPRRSPADILQRRRGGCHGNGAARGAQPPAPAAGLGPVKSVPPRACLPSS